MKRSRRSTKCTTITDVPEEILIDILSRLSIKSIVTCKCVSKTWCNLLSSSNFTKFHFTRSPVQFIIQATKAIRVFELEDDTDVDNSIKAFPSRFRLTRSNMYVVSSCNGFLCLAGSYQYPVIVCNPITGEYLGLPKHRLYGYKERNIRLRVVSGFGFCAKTNEYKVVILVGIIQYNPVTGNTSSGDMMVEIYTIGTKSWRTIGTASKFLHVLVNTTFFNGAIHWLCYDNLSSYHIVSLDLGSEKFGIVPPPPDFSTEPMMSTEHMMRTLTTIGVLGEFLYLSYKKELWVMKEYGVQESWTKMYAVDWRPVGSHQAIKYLRGGKILMNYDGNGLFSYDPAENISKQIKFKFPDIPSSSSFQTIAHFPSFMSFNDAMVGDKGAKLCTRKQKSRDGKKVVTTPVRRSSRIRNRAIISL